MFMVGRNEVVAMKLTVMLSVCLSVRSGGFDRRVSTRVEVKDCYRVYWILMTCSLDSPCRILGEEIVSHLPRSSSMATCYSYAFNAFLSFQTGRRDGSICG